MGSISVTFTGATMEEVARLIAAWSPPVASVGRVTRPTAPRHTTPDDADAVRRVVARVNGKPTLHLLRLLAEAGLKGERVELSEALMRDFAATSGSAFGGMIGAVNKVAADIMGRSLIDYPEPKSSLWLIAPEDAKAVLEALDAK